MSNTSTSPRITIRHLDIYPYNISELYNDVNNLVDTRTIPNYEDMERKRVCFSTTEIVKPFDRRVKGLVALPF